MDIASVMTVLQVLGPRWYMDISSVMIPWLTLPGYPVITVSRDSSTGHVHVAQTRFVFDYHHPHSTPSPTSSTYVYYTTVFRPLFKGKGSPILTGFWS